MTKRSVIVTYKNTLRVDNQPNNTHYLLPILLYFLTKTRDICIAEVKP